MKLVVQRVKEGRVEVGGEVVGAIGTGVLVFVGVTHADTIREVVWLADKLVQLRLFPDDAGKMNRSLTEVGGAALIVSQFTLYAECTQGRRPSFVRAAPPEVAQALYQQFIEAVAKLGVPVQAGRFGADMQVFLVNDGPVTLILDRP